MNSFFIQPTLEAKAQADLAALIRQSALERRLEAQVWQTTDLTQPIREGLAAPSPTFIAVGNNAWLDTLLTAYFRLSPDTTPVFGLVDPGRPSPLERYLPLLTKRRVGGSLSDISARKLTDLYIMQAGSLLFTDELELELEATNPDKAPRLDVEAHFAEGQLRIHAQASRVTATRLETPGATLPLIRFRLHAQPGHNQKTTQSDLLPQIKRATTQAQEEVLHLPARELRLTTSSHVRSLSHPEHSLADSPLTIRAAPKPIRFITAKNSQARY